MNKAGQGKLGSEGIHWDLNDLYSGIDDEKIEKDLEKLTKKAKSFEKHFRGKINSKSVTPEILLKATKELEKISEEN